MRNPHDATAGMQCYHGGFYKLSPLVEDRLLIRIIMEFE